MQDSILNCCWISVSCQWCMVILSVLWLYLPAKVSEVNLGHSSVRLYSLGHTYSIIGFILVSMVVILSAL